MRLPQFVLDPLIRRKAKLDGVDHSRYEIRVARTTREYEDAFRLVHVGYLFQGIEKLKQLDLRITEHHVLPEATVLVAYEGDQIVGTTSITMDSEAGLPLDKDYPEQLASFRRSGARLCEIGSLAVVRRCWRTGVSQLLGLAASRMSYRVMGATHQVIGINPKVASFYRALWAFDVVGPPRHHADLEAPVIGMIQQRARCEAHLTRSFKKPMRTGSSVHGYVFGDEVPDGLEMPEHVSANEWPRWKMSREVFRELFVDRSNRLHELSTRTFKHLKRQRTDQTVGIAKPSRSGRPNLHVVKAG